MRSMLSDLRAVSLWALRRLAASNSPAQLAAGFTLGMIFGLLPKDNFIAATLCLLLLSLRVNKGMGLAAAILFSSIGTSADSFTHKLGLQVLSFEPLQASFAAVYDMPAAPWLGFNNTVVVGSLLVSLYIAYPVYWLTRVASFQLRALWRLLIGGQSGRPWPPAIRTNSSRGAA